MSITTVPSDGPEYVTEVSGPPHEHYLQRLHSRMVEPEPLPEPVSGHDGRGPASQAELDREYNHGAETAYQLTANSAAGGRSADYIEGRHLELTGPEAGQDRRTPAEHRWTQGYAAGAESSVSLLREREAADADERAAMDPAQERGAQYELEAAG
jgi:hypothetical protein